MAQGYSDCPFCGEMYSSRAMGKHKEECSKRPEREYDKNKILTEEIIKKPKDIDVVIRENMFGIPKKKHVNPLLKNALPIKTTLKSGKRHKSKTVFDSFFIKIRYWCEQSYLKINLYNLFETVEPKFAFEDNCLVIRYNLIKDGK